MDPLLGYGEQQIRNYDDMNRLCVAAVKVRQDSRLSMRPIFKFSPQLRSRFGIIFTPLAPPMIPKLPPPPHLQCSSTHSSTPP